MKTLGESCERLAEIMKRLREPGGCPWDRKQTLDTLKKYLIEECYEVLEKINEKDYEGLKEELGDLLLQIVFQSRIAEEEGYFTLKDVIDGISDKLIFRHPHVFGDVKVRDAEEVVENWEKLKKIEKEKKGGEVEEHPLGKFPYHIPSLLAAYEIGKRASKLGFDWEKAEDVIEKIEEELEELKKAMKEGEGNIKEEIGDLLFSIVNLSRKLKISPEEALNDTNLKFWKRFEYLSRRLAEEGKSFKDTTLEEMDKLWEEGKKRKG